MPTNDDTENVTYGLVVAFPDASPSFVNGFEAGGLWQRMRDGLVSDIDVTTHIENREVVARMADNLGWSVERKDSGVEGWDYTALRKIKPAREKANPHGLRIAGGTDAQP